MWCPYKAGLRCSSCLSIATTDEAKTRRDRFPCQGLHPAVKRAVTYGESRGHDLAMLRWGPGGGPSPHQKEGTLALVVCTSCGCYTGKCNKGLAEQCPKMLRGDQGRILKRIMAGWHPRHNDAKLDSAALAKVDALKLMEEA